MQPSRKQRSRPEFSGNGRLLGQLHQQLCGHSRTTLSATRKDTNSNGRKKKKNQSGRQHLKRQNNGIFWPIQTYNLAHSRKLQPRLISSPTAKGIQPAHFISRTMIETEKRYSQTAKDALAIKWAKERLRVNLLGAPRFRIHSAQTTVTLIQWSESHDVTQNRKMDYGNVGRWLWAGVRARKRRSRPPRLPIQAPTTWNRRWQHRKDHQMDREHRTCCSPHKD